MEQMPVKFKLYLILVIVLAAVSIYVNWVTAFKFKWLNLVTLIVLLLFSRTLFFLNLTTEEKAYLKNRSGVGAMTWTLMLITLCIIISALSN